MGEDKINETADIEKELSPYKYFEYVKSRKQTITDTELARVYDNCLELLNKYVKTGQTKASKKLIFHLDTLEKERELVKMGITTIVYKDDMEYYIDHVAKEVVKIIELENFERDIPDEICELIEKTKGLFDQMYVVFTDYTDGKLYKEVEKERDPILFGTFQNKDNRTVIDRFYYIGDWIDDYCDLTLDKMVSEYKAKKKSNVTRTINTPKDINELKEQLDSLKEKNGKYKIDNNAKAGKGLVKRIMAFLTRK